MLEEAGRCFIFCGLRPQLILHSLDVFDKMLQNPRMLSESFLACKGKVQRQIATENDTREEQDGESATRKDHVKSTEKEDIVDYTKKEDVAEPGCLQDAVESAVRIVCCRLIPCVCSLLANSLLSSFCCVCSMC